jgi:hypothetical protein
MVVLFVEGVTTRASPKKGPHTTMGDVRFSIGMQESKLTLSVLSGWVFFITISSGRREGRIGASGKTTVLELLREECG